jgi:hypothetical protein
MRNYICKTCGTQYEASAATPEKCLICEDERQYVNHNGQEWTNLKELSRDHKNYFEKMEDGLISIKTEPGFAIGQRAFLVQSNEGNILWDCITLLDEDTVNEIKKAGGIYAVAISHPHYYSAMTEWSTAFGNIPIYIHKDDKEWVMRKSDSIRFWEGESLSLNNDLTIIRCGGHFDGASVLHRQSGANGKGILLSGDTIEVVPDRKHVSFMYSYPNQIPLNEKKVRYIVNSIEPFEFERIYGAFQYREILSNAKSAVRKSAERYIKAIQ